MNLLVLGGTGYIGRALVKSLATERDMTVWSASRSSAPQPAGVQEVTLDLGNPYTVNGGLTRWLEDHAIDTVIHAAGPPGDAQCQRDMWRAYACHVTTAQSLTLDWPKGRVIYLSTLLDRTASQYADLKHMGEIWVRRNPANLILRLGSVYGAGLNEGVVSRFIRAALHGESVTIFGDGTQTLPLTHIDDVAALVRSAVRGSLVIRGPVEQLYRPECEISVIELLERIAFGVDRPSLARHQAEGPRRPYVVDPAVPCVEPKIGLEAGLARAIADAWTAAEVVPR